MGVITKAINGREKRSKRWENIQEIERLIMVQYGPDPTSCLSNHCRLRQASALPSLLRMLPHPRQPEFGLHMNREIHGLVSTGIGLPICKPKNHKYFLSQRQKGAELPPNPATCEQRASADAPTRHHSHFATRNSREKGSSLAKSLAGLGILSPCATAVFLGRAVSPFTIS